ncbi:MAG: His/Gly/Thr/Pro-type tRNA ligase C-terminal domain-containing protein, partial [bacterium]|nr:His/Gly/Thr/Pro-type tRNA ligase C-terminal domain-containing protein [bacterium]
FIVETEYTGRGLKGQFKQADRLNSKFIAILNSEDLNNNEIKIKNNQTKEEEIISLDVLIYYLDEKLTTDSDDCDCGHECTGECNHDECQCEDE